MLSRILNISRTSAPRIVFHQTRTMSSLPTKQLGRDGPEVTALGFGTMGLSAFYGTPKPDKERFEVLDAVFNKGQLNWDSADVYQDSEDLLGQWFKANPGARDKIFLATKFALRVVDGERKVDSSPEYCKQAIEKSLKRLGLPYVDLYYCHRLNADIPVEKTVEAMAELKKEGKIKHLGLSECSADTLRRACKVHHISAVQIEYSPFSLDIENPQIDLLRTARELGVAIVAYSPIGRGMISGSIRSPDDFEEGDFRKNAPRFQPDNFPKNLELVDKIVEIAKRKGVTSTQLTLAWLLAQGPDIIPIPGTTKVERVEENLGSLKIKLSKEEEAEFREACEKAEVRGERYPAAMQAFQFVDTAKA